MKMVLALINTGQIDKISKSLDSFGISGMTLCEVKCPTDEKLLFRGEKAPYYKSMAKIEIAISDDKVEELVDLLSDINDTNDVFVKKICIFDLKESVRIRTGDKDDKSL